MVEQTTQMAQLPNPRSNRSVAIALLLLFGTLTIVIWNSDWAHRELRDGFTLGGFPLFALAMIGVSLLILILDSQSDQIEEGMGGLTGIFAAAIAVIVGSLVLMFLAQDWIGFIPAASIFIAGWSMVLGYRPAWRAGAIAVLAAVVIRLILGALGVAINDGPLVELVLA